MKWLRFFVFSNLFISLAAGLMMWQSCAIMQVPPKSLSFLTFFGTLFLYNFHRVYRFRNNRLVLAKRYQWVIDHRIIITIFTIVGFFGGLWYVRFLNFYSFLFLFVLAIIALAYVVEFIGKTKPKKALRDLPGLKIVLVATVWAGFMVGLPAMQWHQFEVETIWLWVEKCLFIFAITVPFDIRDMEVDKKEQKTLPQIVGAKKAAAIAVLVMVCALAVACFLYATNWYNLAYLVSQLLAYSLTALLIWLSQKKRNELYYSFLIDGTIILSAMFAFLLP